MIRVPLQGHRSVQLALVALLLSLATFAMTLVRALRLDAPPVVTAASVSRFAVLQQEMRTPNHLIEGAIAAAPFTPAREPGASAQPAAEAAPIETRDIQLAGTVVSNEDSFVLVALESSAPKVARVGDRVGGYRLRSIAQGRAVFTRISDGERLELVVPRSR